MTSNCALATNSLRHRLRSVEREYIWSAKNMGASERELLWQIMLPAAFPQIMTGLQVALPIALILAVFSEMVMGGYGLSETCPMLVLAQLERSMLEKTQDDQLYYRCKAGRPLPLVELRVVDEKPDHHAAHIGVDRVEQLHHHSVIDLAIGALDHPSADSALSVGAAVFDFPGSWRVELV